MPDSLRRRVLEAVRVENAVQRATCNVQRDAGAPSPPHPAGDALHVRLRAAGNRLLAEVLSAPASREHALTLLAADALLTYAMEAEAEAAERR